MGSVILISTVAILVAIVGCAFIWRLDAARAEEIEHTAPPAPRLEVGPPEEAAPESLETPRPLDP